MLTAAQIDSLVQDEAALVAEALGAIYADQNAPLSLEVLQNVAASSGGLFTVSELLLNALETRELVGRFVNYLRPRGVDLEPVDPLDYADLGPVDFCQAAAQNPVAVDFPFDKLTRFISRARAFRCLIRIDGQAAGSGAFVSPRLVLTAAHVIAPVAAALAAQPPADPPKLEILASDKKTYAARLAWHLPNHDDELQGLLPPAGTADTHPDAALLRVDRPLGRLYGTITLPDPPVDWTGCGPFMLVHYPDGVQRDFCPGWILRGGPDDLRQMHSIRTEGGSSGGPGFDREGRFLGLHQGRWDDVRRLVPYDRFAANDDFRTELAADRPPRYLWSLDGSLDGHILIGRQSFFDALTAIAENDAPVLRGVWIKRAHTERTEGLSFSYRILQAFLTAQNLPYDTVRVPTGFETPDLIAQVHELVFGAAPEPAAGAGVQEDETTAVAHDDDRARKLADALEAHARDNRRTLWIYFENPPSGLLQETQIQLEHLVEELLARPRLRLLLAGFETYDLLPGQFTTLAAARRSAIPGLFIEYLDHFTRSDVEVTAKAISAGLGLGWTPDVVAEIVKRAVKHVPEKSANVYGLDQLAAVADNLRREAKASSA